MMIDEKGLDLLRHQLTSAGFQEPYKDWLVMRLSSLEVDYEFNLKREDCAVLGGRAATSKRALDSLWHAVQILDHYEDDLTSPGIARDLEAAPFDPWGAEPQPVLTDSDLNDLTVAPDFTESEVEVARRVLSALTETAERAHQFHLQRYRDRPIKNERPEVAAVIRGFARLWCQAMGIHESKISISSSAGSPAMNFIETGVGFLLPSPPQRETIERHVIAYRREMKDLRHNDLDAEKFSK